MFRILRECESFSIVRFVPIIYLLQCAQCVNWVKRTACFVFEISLCCLFMAVDQYLMPTGKFLCTMCQQSALLVIFYS